MSIDRRLLTRHQASVTGELRWHKPRLLGSATRRVAMTTTDISFDGMRVRTGRRTKLAVGDRCEVELAGETCDGTIAHVEPGSDHEFLSVRLGTPGRAFIGVLEQVVPTNRIADAVAPKWRGLDSTV